MKTLQELKQIDQRIANLKAAVKRERLKQRQTAEFHYKPFSKKQKQVLTWWMDGSPVKEADGIIADGAIRSGKTISMSLSFGLWAMTCFSNQNFLLCGKTIGSLRRNVIFDWKRQMKALGYKLSDSRSENLITVAKGGTVNYFRLFGGKDESSQDLVQGITAAGALFDEVALMPESFVNQATGRCSVTGSKFWFNCNPEGPFHWFKVGWINRIRGIDPDAVFDADHPEKKLVYLHFTMADNHSLSEEICLRYRSMYSGVFYQRFILGMWFASNGLIYDMFNKECNTHTADAPAACRRYISVDYGTINPTVFLAFADDGKKVWLEKEYYYDSKGAGQQKDDSEYAEDFEKFVTSWGYRPYKIIIDPSAASFKLALRKRGFHSVVDADNEVLEGIRKVATLLSLGYLSIHETCTHTLTEMASYVWDEKAAQQTGVEKPIKQQDHAMDALRYFVKTVLRKRRFFPQ